MTEKEVLQAIRSRVKRRKYDEAEEIRRAQELRDRALRDFITACGEQGLIEG